MLTNIKSVLVNEDGATLVEYALVVSLISVACILVMIALGTSIRTTFGNISANLAKA